MEQENSGNDIDKKLKNILSDYNQEEDAQEKIRIRMRRKREIKEKLILYTRRSVIFLSIVAIGYLFVLVLSEQQDIARRPVWAIGIQRSSDYKLRGCIASLWQIRDAIDRFYGQNKIFPKDIKELYDGGFLTKKLECPAGHGEYKFQIVAGKRIVVCPDPAQHGVSSVWLDVRTGPPRIERW
jgi:hypothetical protein